MVQARRCPPGYEWDEELGKCVKIADRDRVRDEKPEKPDKPDKPEKPDKPGKGPKHEPGEDPKPDKGKDDEHGHKGRGKKKGRNK